MCVAIVINANSVLHMLCIYILWEEPTSTDLIGKLTCTYRKVLLVSDTGFSSPQDDTQNSMPSHD